MYIYCITNKINGKQYVGKCVRSVNGSKHYYGSGVYITSSIKKYGKKNFIKEILEELDTSDNKFLCEREIYWVKEKQTKFPNGYNLTDGGDGNVGMLDETKEKIRAKNKLLVGDLNSRYGKNNSEEHNQKIREFNIGKHLSETTKEKIRQANLGKRLSEDSIELMRKSKIGKCRSIDCIKKIRENQPNSIAVMQFTKSGEFIAEYISAAEAMRSTGVFSGSILNCCKGNAKTAGKFIWKYKEEL